MQLGPLSTEAKSPTDSKEKEQKKIDSFSKLSLDLIYEILFMLEGWKVLPLAQVNRFFKKTIGLLRAPTPEQKNSKRNFIYSDIRPSHLPPLHQEFYQEGIKFIQFLQKRKEEKLELDYNKDQHPIVLFTRLGSVHFFKYLFQNYKEQLGKIAFSAIWHIAANFGHVELMRLCLAHEEDIVLDDGGGYTGLIKAARDGHYKIVKLLTTGTNKKCIDLQPMGDTALHSAANKGHVAIVKRLKKSGANENLRNAAGNTALFSCLDTDLSLPKKIAIFNILFHDQKSDTEQKNQEGVTLILKAIHVGLPFSIIKRLYQAGSYKDLLAEDTKGQTALHFAATARYPSVEEHLQVLNFVCEKLVYFESTTPAEQGKFFAFVVKIKDGKPQVLQFFLDKALEKIRAHPSITKHFMVGLKHLAKKGNVTAFQRIFAALKDKPKQIEEILHAIGVPAVKSGNPELIKLLLDHGWRFWQETTRPNVLYFAVRLGHVPLLKLFLERGCMDYKPADDKPRWVDYPETCPPLVTAINFGQADTVEFLVKEAKAEVNYLYKDYWTNLDSCIKPSQEVSPEIKARMFAFLYPLISLKIRKQILEKPDPHGFTLLLYAACYAAPKAIFVHLWEDKAELSQTFNSSPPDHPLNGSNCLHLLARQEGVAVDVLEFLHKKEPSLLERTDQRGLTPLYCAIEAFNVTGVRFFLEKDANALLSINNDDSLRDALSLAVALDISDDRKTKIIELLCAHLQKMASDDSHPRQKAAQQSLDNTLLMTVKTNFLGAFKILANGINKNNIKPILDYIFNLEVIKEITKFVSVLSEKFALLSPEDRNHFFYRYCKKLFDRQHGLVSNSEAILIAFIKAGIDPLYQNPTLPTTEKYSTLYMLLMQEAIDSELNNPPLESISLLIAQLITRIQSNTNRSEAEKVLQQAVFVIIDHNGSPGYLTDIFAAGMKINDFRQEEKGQSRSLFQCVRHCVKKDLAWGVSYLKSMTSQFNLIDKKELSELLYQICLKLKDDAIFVENILLINRRLLPIIKALLACGTDLSAYAQEKDLFTCHRSYSDEIQNALLQLQQTYSKPDSPTKMTRSLMPAEAKSATIAQPNEEAKQEIYASPINTAGRRLTHTPSDSSTTATSGISESAQALPIAIDEAQTQNVL